MNLGVSEQFVSVWESDLQLSYFIHFGITKLITQNKEGVLLRNISAAPICNHFTVGPPGSGIREVGLS